MRVQPIAPYSGGSLSTYRLGGAGSGPLSSLAAAKAGESSALKGLWAGGGENASATAGLWADDEGSTSALSGLWAAGKGDEATTLSKLWTAAGKESAALDGLWSVEEDETAPVGARSEARTAQPGATAAAPARDGGAGEVAQAMGYAATAARSAMTGTSGLAELYRFTNQYYYGTSTQTWARIDTDGDGAWSKSELQDYADAYRQATGRALDVDALWQAYVTDAGRTTLTYAAQQEMYAADALGIAYAKDALIAAEYTGGLESGKVSINQKAFDDFVGKYTYGTANKLYASIDKNEDGVWTLDELTNYADAYYKATGVKLDAEALMAKYDKEGKGYLNYYDQNAMYRDDALGLSRVSDELNARKAAGEDKSADNSLAQKIGESLSSLSKSDMWKLAGAFSGSMQKAAMLDMFVMTNMSIYGRGSRGRAMGLYGGYGMHSLWNAYNMGVGMGYLLR